MNSQGTKHIEEKLISNRKERRLQRDRKSQVHTGLGFPGISTLSPASGLLIGYHHSTFCSGGLLAEFQRQTVGRMTFRHKNYIFPDEKRVGKDFIQSKFD